MTGPRPSSASCASTSYRATEHAAPVAEDDIAILPSGGSALVAPLANDTDPSGGVLVVQSIEVDSDSGIEVALIDRHLLRVTAPAGLDDVARFTYTVSNGSGSATASVAVIPTLAKDDRAPLELQNDSAKVRVGDTPRSRSWRTTTPRRAWR